MKKILILGASGSIGEQTIDVLNFHRDKFELVGLSVGKRVGVLEKIICDFDLKSVCVGCYDDYLIYSKRYPNINWYYGDDGLIEIIENTEFETLVNALVGFVGLKPTLKAISLKKDIALANKETLVVAGGFVNAEVKKYGVNLLPIDSEHSAILQALQGNEVKKVDKLIITASGGSFRDKTREELEGVTKKDALNHPNWSMGAKITIDSATMMNKAFEIIECFHLFNVPIEKIEAVIHPQSFIHSMVLYNDGAIMAQMGSCDMRIPIQYALSYPLRFQSPVKEQLKWTDLTFREIDYQRFPFVKLAFEVVELGDSAGCVVNRANEECVYSFLEDKISFLDIEKYVFMAFEHFKSRVVNSIDDIFALDNEVREFVKEKINSK